MDRQIQLAEARKLITPWAKEFLEPESFRIDVIMDAADLHAASKALKDAAWGYLLTMSGVDHGPDADKMELLVHFSKDGGILTFRIPLPRTGAVVQSICDLYPYASFAERETMEMFGITFAGTPIPEKLFLPDDWPDGQYPLLKDWSPDSLKG